MKLRFLIRTVVIVSVLLLCTGLGVYSFFRLTAEERRSEFNLYSLVPDDAMAVLETDRMADWCTTSTNFSAVKTVISSISPISLYF